MQSPEIKKELRRTVKQMYRELSPEDRGQISHEAIQRLLRRLAALPKGTKVGIFLSMWDELDTTYLIDTLMSEKRLRVLVPRVEGPEMQLYPYDPERTTIISEYGIIEPNNPVEDADVPTVMIVPGIAFDPQGGRVGRGKGFYDKYFSRHKSEITLKIAFVADFQIFDQVPMDEHDIPMDEIITDKSHHIIKSHL